MNVTSVTVIGLGPMGQGMARTLLATGHRATVWNRTPSRVDGLVADGAALATTPAAAIEASELVILSLTDYQAMYDVLGGVTGSLDVFLTTLSSLPPRNHQRRDSPPAATVGELPRHSPAADSPA